MIVLRPYNTAGSVTFVLRQSGSDAFATSANWTPANGDVKLSLDGGTQANATNLPTYSNGQWSLSLTAAELLAAEVRVNIDDGDIVPESILIETYGHANSRWPNLGGSGEGGLTTEQAAQLEAIYKSTSWGASGVSQVG